MRLSGVDMAQATAGRWHGEIPSEVEAVVTDSRSFTEGAAFLALRGPSFDGHAFAADVAEQAVALIGDHQGIAQWKSLQVSQLEVENTLAAFGAIANAWRRRLDDTTVVAISGSYGKTSLRSLLETAFAGLDLKVAATRANLNNLIGVPQTMLAVPVDADVAVIECGISEKGEMEQLAAIVEPDIAILTGITAAHGEGLGGLAGVVHEKAMLFSSMQPDGWQAVGTGVAGLLDQYSESLAADALVQDSDSDEVVRWQLDDCTLTLSCGDEQAAIDLALPASHWAANMAFAASIVRRYGAAADKGWSLQDIAAALALWQVPAGRMQQCRAESGALILDDCYNANPASMQAALSTLRAMHGRRIAVLGDMAELGAESSEAHAGIDVDGCDQLILVGQEMRALADRHAEAQWYAGADALLKTLTGSAFAKGDVILVKGSRSMRLERVVTALRTAEVADAL